MGQRQQARHSPFVSYLYFPPLLLVLPQRPTWEGWDADQSRTAQKLTISQLAAFKYRHQTREGHMEDSLPTLTQDVRDASFFKLVPIDGKLTKQVKSGNHKFYTNK